MSEAVLSVRDLSVSFQRTEQGERQVTDVVRDIRFELHAGETLALVGESGSGKSLTALSILQLLPYPYAFHPSGSIVYRGTELVGADRETLQRIRGNDISMIFQEPMTALNPLHVVEKQIGESLALHQNLAGQAAREEILSLLDKVGIDDPTTRIRSYPHQLSGGQRQRVMIAMALANRPDILLADEPTTALDVTVQSRILALLKSLQSSENLGMLLITHDLNMVRKVADRILVMKDGRLVEQGRAAAVFAGPQDSYTRKLIEAEPPVRKSPAGAPETVLTAEDVKVWYPIRRGLLKRTVGHVKALNRASLRLSSGRTLGVVGESGSGKTTLALALLRLIEFEGRVELDGKPLGGSSGYSMMQIRRSMQVVFQDPYGSLSPRMSIGEIVSEGLDAHNLLTDSAERDREVVHMLREVEIDPEARFRYPHEFSGGQRQRIAIARALILKPRILFLDEPTSALDRTVQIQVLELLERLQRQYGLAYVFISHDLSVIRAIADDLMVMKSGDIVEQGEAPTIFAHPRHPYTRILLEAAFDGASMTGLRETAEG
ncbi:MAG: ABC transporter ATP-binding protein [Gammaproteobacteria bacterium]|nr:ABC transporter ATP-binding protein [Gammaproteobacteria bacterium]MYJ51137.1 ABC transporter ATP-binding protein [Gammaproteobacteria bacterium]